MIASPSSDPSTPTNRGDRSGAGSDFVATLGLAVAVALGLANRFAFDGWLARFDLYTFFVPWYAHLGERLRAGDLPGWNPHLFSGTPFAGDPESGWMYLPAMVAFTLFPVLAGFKAMAVIHLTIAGAGSYLLARRLGMGPGGALVAAMAFVTAPLLQWNTYCCLVLNQFTVWMPLLLLGAEMALRQSDARRAGPGVVLAGFALSQMFGGWVGQGWLLAPLLLAAWIAARGLPGGMERADFLTRLLRCAIVGAGIIGLGLGLGAAGILPRLDVNLQSNLAVAGYEQHGAEGILNPPWTVQHLLAQLMGSAYERRSAAVSGAVLVLACLAPFLARRRFAVPFWTWLVLAATILTLGTTPLHLIAYLIPGFRSLHEHDAWRIYALTPLGFAMLAGAAAEALPEWRGRRARAPLLALPILVMAFAAWWVLPAEGWVGWEPLAAGAAATLVGLWVVLAPVRSPAAGAAGRSLRGASAALAVLVFAQPVGLELTSSRLGWPPAPTWERHWNPEPVVMESLRAEIAPTDPSGVGAFLQERLAEDGPFRYVGYGGVLFPGSGQPANYMARRFEPGIRAILVNGRPMFLGLYETQGYNPIELARYAEFVAAMNGADQDYHTAYLLPSGVSSPLLDLLSARYVVVDAAIPPERADIVALREGRREVFRTDLAYVFERDPAPRHAWVVHDSQVVPRDQALDLLASGAVDPYAVALLEEAGPELGVPDVGASSTARVEENAADELTVTVEAAAPGLLVVSEAWTRGWNATVNGEPTPVLPVHGWLRAVPVPAGASVVEMRYDPLSLRAGIAITAASVVAALAMLVWNGSGRRQPARGRRPTT
jgi:hypothetical protein